MVLHTYIPTTSPQLAKYWRKGVNIKDRNLQPGPVDMSQLLCKLRHKITGAQEFKARMGNVATPYFKTPKTNKKQKKNQIPEKTKSMP